jgi:hypothetical protein
MSKPPVVIDTRVIANPDVPIHVYDLSEVAMPEGPGFYYTIPLDADTGEYVPPGHDVETVLIGPYADAYAARDAGREFVEDVVRGLDAEEANFAFVDEYDLELMQARGTA